MTIRWRLTVLLLQLLTLLGLCRVVTNQWVTADPWFFAGLLGVVINPQLLEPWYARPQDVLVNASLALVLILTADKTTSVKPGWTLLGILATVLILTAIVALIFGANRKEGRAVGVGQAASLLSRTGSATAIYSGVFWVSALEYASGINPVLWTLAIGWLVVVILGRTNWQAVFASATDRPMPSKPEGMVGPSVLLLSGTNLPYPGTRVRLRGGRTDSLGTVVTRIQRSNDAWAEVFVEEEPHCGQLVQASAISIEEAGESGDKLVGTVDAGSSNRAVEFVAIKPLEVGAVVTVPQKRRRILYQITSAQVERSSVPGGAHLITKARGVQLGEFDGDSLRIRRHAWVPAPGAPVNKMDEKRGRIREVPDDWIELGVVIGTDIPVYMDLNQVCLGHLVVLGMTRMGKTTLAVRVANAFAEFYRVTLVDQTGEYVSKRGLPKYKESHEDAAGLSVFEPKPGETPADRTLSYLEWLDSSCGLGWISEPGICNSIEAKQRAAARAVERDDFETACNQLGALANELTALPDTKITTEGRALISLATALAMTSVCD